MKLALGSQMREMDRRSIEEYGIPGIVLMENASAAVAEKCAERLNATNCKTAVFVCGGGNNGGDGFAAARLLTLKGYNSIIYFMGKEEKLKGDAFINYNAAQKMGIYIEKDINKADELFKIADVLVDAIFGTGFSGEPRSDAAEVINKVNNSGKYVISVDIASGVDSETGHASQVCVNANETVSFCMAKVGNMLYPGAEKCGKLTVTNISIPNAVKESMDIKINAFDLNEAKEILPKRKSRSNKGTYGKLFVMAGSKAMGGAAYLCSKSAYRAGCGLVYACVPNECLGTIQSLLPEAVAKPLISDNGTLYAQSFKQIEKEISNAKAIAIGTGLGSGEGVKEFVKNILLNVQCNVVIDADALNALADEPEILLKMKKVPVITPHPGEMSRLTGKSVKEILEDTINTAVDFAKKYNTVVVLKDARTIIASPNGDVYINLTGNNAMAKGGSGDVLTGITGAMLCQMDNAFNAAALSVYIHGLAGDYAAEKSGHYGVLSGEICDMVGEVLKNME